MANLPEQSPDRPFWWPAIQRTFWWLTAIRVRAVFVIGLYVVTFWLVIGSLSAIQIRDSIAIQGLPFAFDKDSQAEIEEIYALRRMQIRQQLERVDTIYAAEEHIRARLTYLQDLFPDAALYYRFGVAREGQLDLVAFAALCSDFFDMSTGEDGTVSFNANISSISPELPLGIQSVTDFRWGCQTIHGLLVLSDELSAMYASGVQEDIEREKDALYAELEALRHYSDFLGKIEFFDKLHLDFVLKAPREILVLIITVVMGVLGSVVTMTWMLARGSDPPSIMNFVLLPFVGGMSAFIILVFLKAGQMSLSGGTADDSLSPFFLSFVGIISGLLSERAYERMAEIGRNFFRSDRTVLRWGVGLQEALDEKGLMEADLARYMGSDRLKTSGIIAGTMPADEEEQTLIAAFLHGHARDFFTDLAPQRADPAPQSAEPVPQGPPAP